MLHLNSQGLHSIDGKIQELIYTISTSLPTLGNAKLDQIKENSISNLHSKI